MIPCNRTRAPKGFGARVSTPGNRWLKGHPTSTERPPGYWRRIVKELAAAFGQRCAYSAMYEPVGTVDHYLSIEGGHRSLAYTWSNYRYAAGWVNSSKGTLDDQVLDPFAVKAGWFEMLLPSMQVVVTDKVPQGLRAKAQFTLDRLHLGHGEQVIRQRRAWYDSYRRGKVTLEGLDDFAPLLAEAIRRSQLKKRRATK